MNFAESDGFMPALCLQIEAVLPDRGFPNTILLADIDDYAIESVCALADISKVHFNTGMCYRQRLSTKMTSCY